MSFWTDEVISRLESLWERGYSCGLIAEMLGTSRNAVAGKAWRLQLPEREVLYTKPKPRRRGRPFEFRRRVVKVKPVPKPRHNGDFSWHLQQIEAGVALRADRPPAPPPGFPSWRTFRRRITQDSTLAHQLQMIRYGAELRAAA